MINLDSIEMLNHPPVIELFVYLIFSEGMFDVIIFDLAVPAIIEVVDFARYLSTVFEIKCLVNFREASFT